MSGQGPLDELCQEAIRQRSGEFICAGAAEVHVFLQRGRVAWATDSSHPFEFVRQLRERCGITEETFREVLKECRQSHVPLGQTLVSWGLASWQDVRAALEHQLRLALATLAALRPGASMFLERQKFAEYDEKLTFSLHELLEAEEEQPAEAEEEQPVASPVSASELLAAIRGASWIQILEGGRCVDAAPDAELPAVPAELAERSLRDGADFVALRGADRSILGANLGLGTLQLWCMLSRGSAFGMAVSVLSTRGLLAKADPAATAATLEPVSWRIGDTAACTYSEQVFEFGRDVLALLSVGADGTIVAGSGRAGIAAEACEALVRRRAGALAATIPGAPGPVESLGFGLRSMVTGEPEVWCFGAETEQARPSATLWVITRREAVQGIGWACLTALGRGGGQRRRRHE